MKIGVPKKSKRTLKRNELSTSEMSRDCTYYELETVSEKESVHMSNPADDNSASAPALTFWHDLRKAEALLHWQRWQNRPI